MFGCEPLVNTMYVCDKWMDPTNGATAYNRAKIHCQPFDVCLFPLYECVLYAMIERVFTTNILCALYVTVTTPSPSPWRCCALQAEPRQTDSNYSRCCAFWIVGIGVCCALYQYWWSYCLVSSRLTVRRRLNFTATYTIISLHFVQFGSKSKRLFTFNQKSTIKLTFKFMDRLRNVSPLNCRKKINFLRGKWCSMNCVLVRDAKMDVCCRISSDIHQYAVAWVKWAFLFLFHVKKSLQQKQIKSTLTAIPFHMLTNNGQYILATWAARSVCFLDKIKSINSCVCAFANWKFFHFDADSAQHKPLLPM